MQRPRIYQFGEYIVSPLAHELRRGTERIALPPHAFDCLIYLIEHRERVVGRDELIAAVWGRTDTSDEQVGRIIRKARRAIGERGDEEGAIRTIPRVGFHWVREVSLLPDHAKHNASHSSPSLSSASAEAGQARPSKRASQYALLAAIAAVIVGGIAGLRLKNPDIVKKWTLEAGSVSGTSEVIAVLPVSSGASSDPAWTWLRLGLMDYIDNQLTDAGQFVVPSYDVISIIGEAETPDAAADKLRAATGVRHVLVSTATRSDKEWTVHLELHSNQNGTWEGQASAPQVIDAARRAIEQLLTYMEGTEPPGRHTLRSPAPDELIQRAEAAALTDHLDEASQLLESASAEMRGSPELQLRLARINQRSGKLDIARDQYLRLLAGTPAETDALFRARILNGLAAIDLRTDKAASAEQRLTESIALLAGLGELHELGTAYYLRGTVNSMHGKYDDARSDFAKARLTFEKINDGLAQARVDVNEGGLNNALSRPDAALDLFRRAAERLDHYGAVAELSVAIGNEITTLLDLLQPAAALDIATKVGGRFDQLQNPLWLHMFKWKRACALLENGHLKQGREILDELIKNLGPSETGLLGMTRSVQAEADFNINSFETAVTLSRQAIAAMPIASGSDWLNSERARAWLSMTRALRALNRIAEARDEVEKFSAWSSASQDAAVVLSARLAEAEQAWSEGKHDAAVQIYDDLSRPSARNAESPADIAKVVSSYGSRLIEAGELEKAAGIVGQVARFAGQEYNCALLQVRFYRALGQADAWRASVERARRLAGERVLPADLADFGR